MRRMGTTVVIRPLSPDRFDPVRPGTTNSPPSLTAVATIDGALVEVEIGERPNLVHVIARVLNGALIAVLDDVLKEAQTLGAQRTIGAPASQPASGPMSGRTKGGSVERERA